MSVPSSMRHVRSFGRPATSWPKRPKLHDIVLYHSVPAAIASGNAARGGIAYHLGLKSTAFAHALSVIQDVRMITREAWELYKISQSPQSWGRITRYKGGRVDANPFK